jgi:hypothetical protein
VGVEHVVVVFREVRPARAAGRSDELGERVPGACALSQEQINPLADELSPGGPRAAGARLELAILAVVQVKLYTDHIYTPYV